MRTVRLLTVSRSILGSTQLPPLDTDPPRCRPPWMQTPSPRCKPPGCRPTSPPIQNPLRPQCRSPPGCRPSLIMWPVMNARKPTPPLSTEWQTGVKTLPCSKPSLREVKMAKIQKHFLYTLHPANNELSYDEHPTWLLPESLTAMLKCSVTKEYPLTTSSVICIFLLFISGTLCFQSFYITYWMKNQLKKNAFQ